jgi:hypothetical protein
MANDPETWEKIEEEALAMIASHHTSQLKRLGKAASYHASQFKRLGRPLLLTLLPKYLLPSQEIVDKIVMAASIQTLGRPAFNRYNSIDSDDEESIDSDAEEPEIGLSNELRTHCVPSRAPHAPRNLKPFKKIRCAIRPTFTRYAVIDSDVDDPEIDLFNDLHTHSVPTNSRAPHAPRGLKPLRLAIRPTFNRYVDSDSVVEDPEIDLFNELRTHSVPTNSRVPHAPSYLRPSRCATRPTLNRYAVIDSDVEDPEIDLFNELHTHSVPTNSRGPSRLRPLRQAIRRAFNIDAFSDSDAEPEDSRGSTRFRPLRRGIRLGFGSSACDAEIDLLNE